jgi:trimethylamine--corrinoid protein Co-methyltransferase
VPDSQAAHEKTITSLLPALAGANTIYGSGMLELGVTFSMEQLVIDNDIIAMEKKAMEGVPISEETLAIDAIKEIGVGNDFIGHPSTMDNIDLASDPLIFDRFMIGDWKAAGSKSAVDVAHDIVVDVMKNHVVEPIPADKLKNMEAIVNKADAAFLKDKE